MPIPDHQTIMRPLLSTLADGAEHRFGDLVPRLADHFSLTKKEREHLLPSGRQAMFRNRVHWSAFYLRKGGLVERPRRGIFRITERGNAALRQNRTIDNDYLEQFPEFREFLDGNPEHTDQHHHQDGSGNQDRRTPEELLEAGYASHRAILVSEVLARLKEASPGFFEQVVIDLLVAMGYGGSRQDAGRAVGRSGDGGIDGIIKEDRLGLDAVYVQAKRWESTVGRPAVQAFAGSLEGHRARKGVLITTSDFSSDARDYVTRIEKRIVLLGGSDLAELMVEHGIGVTDVATYKLKRLDTDYFEESE
jgi:restriction system protein